MREREYFSTRMIPVDLRAHVPRDFFYFKDGYKSKT